MATLERADLVEVDRAGLPGLEKSVEGLHEWCRCGGDHDRTCLVSHGDAPDQGTRAAGGLPMSQPMRWADPARAMRSEDHLRPLPSVQCSLCGITLPTGLMVPDGGQACADVRWYCQDAKSCTERWTASLSRTADVPPTQGDAHAGGGAPGSG